jgi:hypothetical protein
MKNANMLHGKVTNSVYIGADTHIYTDVHGVKIKILEQNRVSHLDPKSFYAVGQDISMVLMPENTLVLKKE